MLRNYLKIAYRNLKRNKGYAFINIGGLAVGMACCLLIVLYVQDELSYDRFHEKAERIYRVNLEVVPSLGVDRPIAITPNIVAPLLAREFLGVEKAVRLRASGGVVRCQDRAFREDDFFFADSTFFDIFTFPFVAGDPETALARPNTVVLTESVAQRYFGDENPLGKTILFDNDTELEVTGIIEDVPSNAHFHFDFVASWASLGDWAQGLTWGSANFYTYLLLRENTDADALGQKIDRMVAEREAAGGDPRALSLMPLTHIHLYADLAYALDPTGDIRYVYVFSALAVLILLIACVNYMNLATARSEERAVEIGMRKVAGATRPQLLRQLYGEAILLVGIALLLALALVQLGLPLFNALSGKSYAFTDLSAGFLLMGLGGIGLLVGIVAGSYPALVLSAFRPARVLKGTFRTAQGAIRFRKGLVIFQFAIAVFLVAGTFVIRGQLDYLQSKNLGFDKERVVMLPADDPALKEAFLQHTGVQSVSLVNQYPSALGWTGSAHAEGRPEDATVLTKGFITDEDIIETLGLELVAGRGFSETSPHPDSVKSGYRYLLNETLVRALGWTPEEAPGKRFNVHGSREGRVIGVVKDFHYASLREVIEPMAIWYHPDRAQYLLVRIAPGAPGSSPGQALAGTLAFLKNRWAELMPHSPFTYRFLDDAFDALYRSEQQTSRVFSAFAALAILIACLGLFGLAAYATERRTKEIGIRKVLGASVPSIVALLSKDFLKLVLIAFVIAAPVAYYAMQRWLQDFAYRIDLGVGIFLLAGALALVIALATVSYQAIRAALANPVEALRDE